jgi:glycine C-acetyltransferase
MSSKPLDFLTEELQQLKDQGLYMPIHKLEGMQLPRSVINGKEVINIASNNYLGLATHPKLKRAAIEAIEKYGVGAAAARLICGNMPLHEELENRIAEFKETEAAIAFQTGYATNDGVIPSIVGKDDTIVSDELNHASLIDGSRMSRAKIRIYKHCDPDSAEAELKAAREENAGHILLVTDSIFSMDGDIAPLPGLVEKAKKYGAITMVDDAHAVGVLGKGGQGIVSHFDLHGQVEIQMGTLSKALGVMGGYIAGSQDLIDWLMRRHRPFVFSASTHTPPDVAACIAAIEVLQEEPERVERLWENARYFRQGLDDLGFDTGMSQSPIIPVIVGKSEAASNLSKRLFEEGVFATAIVYPVVARDQARLRTLMSSEHTRDDIDEALGIFERVGKELSLI